MRRSRHVVLYAASLDLRGVPVLVVGGGDVALRKVRALLEAEAEVTAVSLEFHGGFSALRSSRMRQVKRGFRFSDLKNKSLVFAATDNEILNTQIARRCKKARVPVNVAAPPEAGTFHVPATFRRGPLAISISSGGASAALTKTLREHLEKNVGAEWSELAALLEARRDSVRKGVKDPQRRRDLLSDLGAARWARVLKQRGAAFVAAKMDALIANAAGAHP